MTTLDADPEVEALLDGASGRRAAPPPRREMLVEAAAAAALALVCAAMALTMPEPVESPLLLAALVAAYAIAGRVRFDVGSGYTGPTQLVLVPLLFAAPPALAPLLVAAACVLRRVPDCVRGDVHPLRLLVAVPDAWYVVGPALVLGVAGVTDPAPGELPIYAAAFAAQVVFDAGASAVRELLVLVVAPALHLRLLVWIVAVDAALAPGGLLAAVALSWSPVAAVAATLPPVWLLAVFARERDQRIRQALQLSSAYRGTALLLGDVLEADDQYTGGEHSQGVVALALRVGKELRLGSREQRNLEFGALLHDIGKLRVSNEILNKPGKLNAAEWEVIRRHPVDGQEMLERVGGTLGEVGKIVRAHHERVDGKGYPDGLRGEEIPLPARIICAVDAYNAMTTTRAYREAMPREVAIAELRGCAGKQFDPLVVEAIVRVVGEPQVELRAAA
jgi:putative nucleotidyltransferase with HDIG domain